MTEPLLLLVSGPGGSGKTTLAVSLADRLSIVRLDRDGIANGEIFTNQHRTMTHEVLRDTVYTTLHLWLSRGVSVVLDLTTFRGLTEPELLSRIPDDVQLLNVHLSASNARERCRDRLEATGHPLATKDLLDQLFQRYDWELPQTLPPPNLSCPLIEVDTSDGYDPPLDEIVSEVLRLIGRPE